MDAAWATPRTTRRALVVGEGASEDEEESREDKSNADKSSSTSSPSFSMRCA